MNKQYFDRDKAYVAFYKARGTIVDRIIRFIDDRGDYSHAEIIVDQFWHSASIRDGGVRRKTIRFTPENWDVFEMDPSVIPDVRALFQETKGAKYDFYGIFFSHVLPLNWHNKNRFFCTEWIAKAFARVMQIEQGFHTYSPNKLFSFLNNKQLLRKVDF